MWMGNNLNIDLKKYQQFVEAVTSEQSHDLTKFMNQLDRLDANCEKYGEDRGQIHGPDVNVPLLLCGLLS